MNTLAGGELAFPPGDGHALCSARLEMHLDATRGRVVEGDVREGRRIEVAAQQRVDVIEDVAVECRGDPERIVVGSGQPRAVLGRVDSDQKPAAAEAQVADLGEES